MFNLLLLFVFLLTTGLKTENSYFISGKAALSPGFVVTV